ncbi:DUF4817 domain-containing protein [Trichonephila clavipes]|nr:DUF4817 domain-containing protein [Trichonephila clavipes]
MMFSQEQRIAIVEFYFSTKSHCHVINAFQQKYPSETSPNTSTITQVVLRFRDTGSVAGRKRSGKASRVITKVANVETALQNRPIKMPSVYINNITEFNLCRTGMNGILVVARRCNVSHITEQVVLVTITTSGIPSKTGG